MIFSLSLPAADPHGSQLHALPAAVRVPGTCWHAASSHTRAGSVSTSRHSRQDAATTHRLHVAAAARAGEAIQAEQVFVTAQTLRGGQWADALGDAGEDLVPESSHEMETLQEGAAGGQGAGQGAAAAAGIQCECQLGQLTSERGVRWFQVQPSQF